MALKLSVAVRNAGIDAIETEIGPSAVLRLRTGAPPASIDDPDSGTVLVTITLPADWMAAAFAGSKTKLGLWQGNGSAAGNAGHFRIYASNGTTQHIQGTVTGTGGGGNMIVDNVNIAVGQPVTHKQEVNHG